MISFGNGREISTIAISTACGYDGWGIFPYTTHRDYGDMVRMANATGTTRISKSMTRHKRIGNFRRWFPWTWRYIQNLGDDGMLNAYGLTNKGVEAHSQEIAQAIADGVQIIPNFSPEFAKGVGPATKETLEAIAILEERIWWPGGFWAIEINLSCPNIKGYCVADNVKDALWCVGQVRKNYPDLVVIAKISVVHPPEFAKQLHEAGADVIHSANTVPYNMLFNGDSPLQKVGGGGVSGGPAFQKVLEFNKEVLCHYQGPIIFGCGIVDDQKLFEYQQRLASSWEYIDAPDQSSFSICTAALRRPEWVKEVIQNFNS